jgi:hypothetical protein
MAIQKQKRSIQNIERTLTYAGLAVISVGCVASIFYASTNQRFIYDLFPTAFYYLQYLLLLGGGFVVGYVATKPQPGFRYSRLFSAVCYAFLAVSLFTIYDIVRVLAQNTLGDFDYPFGKYVFELGAVIALLITSGVALVLQNRRKVVGFSNKANWIFITTFLFGQLYLYGEAVIYRLTQSSLPYYETNPWWPDAAGFLLNPIIVALVSYVALSRITDRSKRILYAVFISSFFAVLISVLWNFRTDASYEATFVFQSFVSLISLVAAALLILKVRTATKS